MVVECAGARRCAFAEVVCTAGREVFAGRRGLEAAVLIEEVFCFFIEGS